ncbi:hypothetical protein KCP73_18440 [Salmonella enterica subsp. enterica]|nr:hypothetical protein KCP73_18440 [Salmonella enterica subsp. enterica]
MSAVSGRISDGFRRAGKTVTLMDNAASLRLTDATGSEQGRYSITRPIWGAHLLAGNSSCKNWRKSKLVCAATPRQR